MKDNLNLINMREIINLNKRMVRVFIKTLLLKMAYDFLPSQNTFCYPLPTVLPFLNDFGRH